MAPQLKLRTFQVKQKFSYIKDHLIVGGCGAMFSVRVESPQFNGMARVKQQKLINEVLREQIKQMHGIRIETKAIEKK